MMILNRTAVLLVAALLAPSGAARGDQPPAAKSDREYLQTIRGEARELLRALEQLKEYANDELSGQNNRKLYRQIEPVLSATTAFLALAADGVARDKLSAEFEKLDARLHQLIEVVDALQPRPRVLLRVAARLRAADYQLHHALAPGESSEARTTLMLERQGTLLADAAEGLERVASYAVGTAPGRAPLLDELAKLSKSSQHFAARLEKGTTKQYVEQEFAALTQAWHKVTGELQGLSPEEHLYFLRTACQFDRVHERIHRLLGVKGQRPQLIIRT